MPWFPPKIAWPLYMLLRKNGNAKRRWGIDVCGGRKRNSFLDFRYGGREYDTGAGGLVAMRSRKIIAIKSFNVYIF